MTRKIQKFGAGGSTKTRKLEWGAKTGIEEAAADDAVIKQFYKSGPARSAEDDAAYQKRISSAMKEARDEIKRETRGKAPEAYKKGGMAKGGKWIQSAIKKPGALRAQLGVNGDKPIPAGKLAKAAKAPGKLGQRARLAQTLKKMK